MNDKVLSGIETTLAVCGLGVSLAQIEQVLGIVLLVIQIGIIIFRLVAKAYKHTKEDNPDALIKDAEEAKEEIERLTGGKKDGQ